VTVVLHLLREPEIHANRKAISDWFEANGVDHEQVLDRWISIERDDDQHTVIRYRQYKTTTEGRRLVDPDHDDQAWSEERTIPLTVPLTPHPADATAPAADAKAHPW
jgi:hypothetical protein